MTHGFIQDADANILVELADNLAVHKAPQLLPAANTRRDQFNQCRNQEREAWAGATTRRSTDESSHAK